MVAITMSPCVICSLQKDDAVGRGVLLPSKIRDTDRNLATTRREDSLCKEHQIASSALRMPGYPFLLRHWAIQA